MIEEITVALETFADADPEGWKVYNSIEDGDTNPPVGFSRVDHDRYQWIVDMRAWLKQQRRSG